MKLQIKAFRVWKNSLLCLTLNLILGKKCTILFLGIAFPSPTLWVRIETDCFISFLVISLSFLNCNKSHPPLASHKTSFVVQRSRAVLLVSLHPWLCRRWAARGEFVTWGKKRTRCCAAAFSFQIQSPLFSPLPHLVWWTNTAARPLVATFCYKFRGGHCTWVHCLWAVEGERKIEATTPLSIKK